MYMTTGAPFLYMTTGAPFPSEPQVHINNGNCHFHPTNQRMPEHSQVSKDSSFITGS